MTGSHHEPPAVGGLAPSARREGALDVPALAAEIDARLAAERRVTAPVIHALRSEYSRLIRDARPRDVVALALALHAADRRAIGDLLLANHRPGLANVGPRALTRLARGLDTWDAVDVFGVNVAGPVWRADQVDDAFVLAWARSRDRWLRRAALVATVGLNQALSSTGGDAPRTVAVCALLVDDRDDMVVKALSWALRVLASREPGAVSDFVAMHDGALAARVRREVRNKLRTGVKSPSGGASAAAHER